MTSAASGSYYVYAEASSSGYPSVNFWLRSPEILLGGNPVLSYSEARSGATIGSLDVYLDVIVIPSVEGYNNPNEPTLDGYNGVWSHMICHMARLENKWPAV